MKKLISFLLALALLTALGAPALAAQDAELPADIAYVGDRAELRMSAEVALAYVNVIRGVNKPVIRASLFDAGGGSPLLWVAWGDGIDFDTGALTGDYDDRIYGYDGGLYECPWMTTLLRAGENGVMAQMNIAYYSDFAEEFRLYRLSGGRIADAPFASGTFDPLNDSYLNGVTVPEPDGLLGLYRMAAGDNIRVLLNAESGLADMLFLTGDWSDGGAMAAALTVYAQAAPAAKTAYASTQTVELDGRAVEFQCYALKDAAGNPTNYIKLRDLAKLLSGTAAQFDVGWDGSVVITTGKAYVPNGSEGSTPFSGDRSYQDTDAVTKVDGAVVDLAAFMLTDDNGGGYTYYKLRDLGEALGFNVGWSAQRGIFVETDKPYDPAD